MKTDNNLVVIAEYNNDFNANIGLTKLREAGIPAILNNETTANVFGVPLAPYDTIRLLVLRAAIDRARDILASSSEEEE